MLDTIVVVVEEPLPAYPPKMMVLIKAFLLYTNSTEHDLVAGEKNLLLFIW